jgi:hypothetical protein
VSPRDPVRDLVSGEPIVFEWSDVWVFVSVVFAAVDGKAQLSAVLLAGDGINHAKFVWSELRRGLAKLEAAGFVYDDGEMILLTEAGASFYDEHAGRHRAVDTIRQKLEAALRVQPWNSSISVVDDAQITYSRLTDERLGNAEKSVARVEARVGARTHGKKAKRGGR